MPIAVFRVQPPDEPPPHWKNIAALGPGARTGTAVDRSTLAVADQAAVGVDCGAACRVWVGAHIRRWHFRIGARIDVVATHVVAGAARAAARNHPDNKNNPGKIDQTKRCFFRAPFVVVPIAKSTEEAKCQSNSRFEFPHLRRQRLCVVSATTEG